MKLFKNILIAAALLVSTAQAEQEISPLGKRHSLTPLQLNTVNDLCEIIHPTKTYIGDPSNGGPVLWAFPPAKSASVLEVINALSFYQSVYRNLIIYFDDPRDDMRITKRFPSTRETTLDFLSKLAETKHIPIIIIHKQRVNFDNCYVSGSFETAMYRSLFDQRSVIQYFVDGKNEFYAFGIDRMLGTITHIKNMIN